MGCAGELPIPPSTLGPYILPIRRMSVTLDIPKFEPETINVHDPIRSFSGWLSAPQTG